MKLRWLRRCPDCGARGCTGTPDSQLWTVAYAPEKNLLQAVQEATAEEFPTAGATGFQVLRKAWWELRGCWYAVLDLPFDDARVQAHRKERFGVTDTLFAFRRWEHVLLLRLLQRYRLALYAEDKEAAAEQVEEVMDMVVGYCSPHMRLTNFLGRTG